MRKNSTTGPRLILAVDAAHTCGLRLLALALLIAGPSCSTEPAETTAPGVWGRTTVVEELRIGVDTGPEELMLGTVRSLAVAADGTIYMSDNRPRIVRAFDRDGNFLRNIGREGQGPGEYMYPPPLRVLPNGMLALFDSGTSRLSLFSDAGEYLGGFISQGPSGEFRGFEGLQTDVEENVYILSIAARTGPEGGWQPVLDRYTIEGEPRGTVPLPDQQAEGRTFILAAEGNLEPFIVLTCFEWSPLGYLVVGRNDRYEIELRKPSGTERISRELDPIPLEPEERSEWEAFREMLVTRALSRGNPADYAPIPEHKPFFRRIHVGDDGRIWVHRYVAAVKRTDVGPDPTRPERPILTWREPVIYDVLEPDGTFLGAVVMPDGFEPYVFRGSRIWGVETDEAGVEQIVRLRVDVERE